MHNTVNTYTWNYRSTIQQYWGNHKCLSFTKYSQISTNPHQAAKHANQFTCIQPRTEYKAQSFTDHANDVMFQMYVYTWNCITLTDMLTSSRQSRILYLFNKHITFIFNCIHTAIVPYSVNQALTFRHNCVYTLMHYLILTILMTVLVVGYQAMIFIM